MSSSLLYVYRYEGFINHLETASDKVISVPSEEQTTCEYFESFLKAQVFKSKALEMFENLPVSNPFPVAFRLEKHDYEDTYEDTYEGQNKLVSLSADGKVEIFDHL